MLDRAPEDYKFWVGISFPGSLRVQAKFLQQKLEKTAPIFLPKGPKPVFCESDTEGSHIIEVGRRIAKDCLLIVLLANDEYAIRKACREEWKHISLEHERWAERVYPLCFDDCFEDAGFGRRVETEGFTPPTDYIWQRTKEIVGAWKPKDLKSVFLSPNDDLANEKEYFKVQVEPMRNAIQRHPWQEHAVVIDTNSRATMARLQEFDDSHPGRQFALYCANQKSPSVFSKVTHNFSTGGLSPKVRSGVKEAVTLSSLLQSFSTFQPMNWGTLRLAAQLISMPPCNVFYADQELQSVLRSALRRRFDRKPHWLGCRWFDVLNTDDCTIVSAATSDFLRLNVFIVTDGFIRWVKQWTKGNGRIGPWLPGIPTPVRDQIMLVTDDLLKDCDNRKALEQYWRHCRTLVSRWQKVTGAIEDSDVACQEVIHALSDNLEANSQ
ncbi:MAG TPA: hypothetical protein VHA33_05030 [Candidatus Angelobacter sp.]|jgi:hypothetical protein|nr:hypothetical protein [Candidatus Angelobacter sp.]